MAKEAPSKEDRFVEISWGFYDILVYFGEFLVLRWTMLKKVLRVAALWDQPCLVAKSS
jgi:hypothetical protein